MRDEIDKMCEKTKFAKIEIFNSNHVRCDKIIDQYMLYKKMYILTEHGVKILAWYDTNCFFLIYFQAVEKKKTKHKKKTELKIASKK